MKGDLSLLKQNGDLFWYFQRYYALCVTTPSETRAAFNTLLAPISFFFFFGKLFIDVLFLCWIELASAAHASLNRAEVGSAGVQLGQKSALTVPLCGRAHRKRMWNALLRPKDWVCVGISLQLIQRYTHCNAICLFLCGCLLTDPVCYTALCTLCSSQYVWIIGRNNYIHLCHIV